MEDKSSPFLGKVKNLNEFLRLSPEEEKLKNDLLGLLNKKEPSNKVEAMIQQVRSSNYTMVTLIKIAEHSENFFQFLRLDELKSFWEEAWRLMGANQTSKKHKQDMKPQPNLDCIDLFFGYFYYQEAMKIRNALHKKFSAQEIHYLQKAENYFSFHALNSLNKHDLEALKLHEKNNSRPDLSTIMNRTLTAAKYHGTPGYLIAAETCFAIAQFHKAVNLESAITPALILSIKYLKLANLYFDCSAAAINNAYFGLGIVASNAYGLENITEIKNLIIQYSGNYLEPNQITFAEKAAQIEYEDKSHSKATYFKNK